MKLYKGLKRNADTTTDVWTREGHDKLIAALGWRSECFPAKHFLIDIQKPSCTAIKP